MHVVTLHEGLMPLRGLHMSCARRRNWVLDWEGVIGRAAASVGAVPANAIAPEKKDESDWEGGSCNMSASEKCAAGSQRTIR
jgi:hypothetical protein